MKYRRKAKSQNESVQGKRVGDILLAGTERACNRRRSVLKRPGGCV
jgi:hypothetical protein